MSYRIALATAAGMLLAAAAVTPARADPVLDYTIGASLQHSDNINYSATDPVSACGTPSLAQASASAM